MELHLWKEGTFLRAYDWSAWLACRYLHEFKVNKRQFKGILSPTVKIVSQSRNYFSKAGGGVPK